jgi:hypothetical protein
VTGATPYGLIWAILVYAWIANYLIRMALSALLPPIMAEFGLTYTQAGLLSAAVFYAYASMQLPAGALGDRLGRRRMVIAGVLLSAGASVFTGMAGTLALLFAARLATGFSQGFLFSNDRVIIAATTPPGRMALGQGISFSGPGLGTTLGLVLAGYLGTLLPWRHVFLLFALPPLLAAWLLWRFVPEPPRATAAADPAWPFRRVLRTRDFWLLAISGMVPIYVQFLLATWGPALFMEAGVRDLARSASLASLQGTHRAGGAPRLRARDGPAPRPGLPRQSGDRGGPRGQRADRARDERDHRSARLRVAAHARAPRHVVLHLVLLGSGVRDPRRPLPVVGPRARLRRLQHHLLPRRSGEPVRDGMAARSLGLLRGGAPRGGGAERARGGGYDGARPALPPRRGARLGCRSRAAVG